jgi:hypothetical protein
MPCKARSRARNSGLSLRMLGGTDSSARNNAIRLGAVWWRESGGCAREVAEPSVGHACTSRGMKDRKNILATGNLVDRLRSRRQSPTGARRRRALDQRDAPMVQRRGFLGRWHGCSDTFRANRDSDLIATGNDNRSNRRFLAQ